MSTYTTGVGDDRHITSIGKPIPTHALTPGAEAARAALRALPPLRVTADGTVTRKLLTRDEVTAAYVHPEPEVPGHEVKPEQLRGSPGAFVKFALAAGADVKATVSRGTTPPSWDVNAPDSKPNPGPPVEPSQYHGDVVDAVVVWVVAGDIGKQRMTWIRAEWNDGLSVDVMLNGAHVKLTAAKAALS
ncbi:MAG: hypothetical protein JWO98_5315 [Frankiales bacterium]|nr:hypothetical protein [Frankiales bacterium]